MRVAEEGWRAAEERGGELEEILVEMKRWGDDARREGRLRDAALDEARQRAANAEGDAKRVPGLVLEVEGLKAKVGLGKLALIRIRGLMHAASRLVLVHV